ncbi:hypothetical protein [Staphylococcus delphini]|uniref:hypothetical protein n=1 Tax=Staphylococcus delphini TaxID=53344 RepID=UPI0021D38A95|nr:hypothetical protein [Staphylococcus delphini]UXS21190.1 hypothetical protein MUA22_10205 [Staphylococcus delphini]
MWLITAVIALLITVVIVQHTVIIKLKNKRYILGGGLADRADFNHIKTERYFYPKSLAKPEKERGTRMPPGKELYLEKHGERGSNEMIKKAMKKPEEVEYIEFKGYKNFKEVCEFVGYHFSKFVLKANRYSEEVVATDNGTFETGVIFYRYLDEDTEEYKYDVMSKEKFFRIYTAEVNK